MSRPPDFDELMHGVEDPDERARLQRVHELLLETDAPPELSFDLATPPPAAAHMWSRPRRRLRPRNVLVGAAIFATFLIGYLAGSSGTSDVAAKPLRGARTIALKSNGEATGAVGIGVRDSNGNWPMIVTVWGLEPLQGGDYYRLALTKKGKPIVTCGTFNVSGPQTTIRLTAAYRLAGFDGWMVTLWRAKTHDEKPVLWANKV